LLREASGWRPSRAGSASTSGARTNPLAEPVFDRFAAATGKSKRHTVLLLTYDTARLVAEGLAREPADAPKGVKEGLEKVRMLPAANGGPRTHMSPGH
jgi:hypothetical protein